MAQWHDLTAELPLAGITRTSAMGDRKADSETFHADEDERAAIERYARELGRERRVPGARARRQGQPGRSSERPSLRAGIEGVEARPLRRPDLRQHQARDARSRRVT